MKIDEGIDNDGIIDDPLDGLETYYAPLEYLRDGDGFLRAVGDDGGIQVEIRIPFENLEKMGWRKENITIQKKRQKQSGVRQ